MVTDDSRVSGLRGALTLTLALCTLPAGIAVLAMPSYWWQILLGSWALVAFAWSFRNLRVALVVLLLSQGATGLRLTVMGVPILIEYIALIPMFVHAFQNRELWRTFHTYARRLPDAWSIGITLLVFWLLFIQIANSAAADPWQSTRLTLWLIASIVSLVVIPRAAIGERGIIELVSVAATIYSAIALIGWGYAQSNRVESIFVERDYISGFYRSQGLAFEPNIMASYLTLAACITAVYARHVRHKFLVAQFVLSGVVVFLSLTRTAWPLFLIAVVVCLCTVNRVRAWIVAALTGSLMYFGLPYIGTWLGFSGNFSESLTYRFSSFLSFDSGTGRSRANTSSIAWDEIQHDGYFELRGLNAFPQTHGNALASNGEAYLSSWWLSLVYDGGVISAVLFVAACGALFVAIGWRGALLALSIAIVSATTNPLWFSFPWTMIAIAFVASRLLNADVSRCVGPLRHPPTATRAEAAGSRSGAQPKPRPCLTPRPEGE